VFLGKAFGAIEIGSTIHAGLIVNLPVQIGSVTQMIRQADNCYQARLVAVYIYVEDAYASMPTVAPQLWRWK
jgi:hypothetical protein